MTTVETHGLNVEPSPLYAPLSARKIAAFIGSFLIVSSALLALAQNESGRGDATLHFYVFWAGFACAVIPIGVLLVSRRVSSLQRGALVISLACWSLLPKWIRTGAQPLYADEFQHLRLLRTLANTGHATIPESVLQVGGTFPGLELLTNGLSTVSGLSLWWSAIIVASLAHVLLLVGVYVLILEISGSARAGAFGALIYLFNPSFLYFDAQYAYETLALPLAVWSIVFAHRAITTRPVAGDVTPRSRRVAAFAAMFNISALLATHHVTSVITAGLLLLYAVIVSVRQFVNQKAECGESLAMAWLLALFASALTFTRFFQLRHILRAYLSPVLNVSAELHQLGHLFGVGSGPANRAVFGGSSIPFFEQASAYVMIPVLLAGLVLSLWILRGRWGRINSLMYVGAALGVLYFVSLPFDTALSLSQAVHRSWADSFIGLAVVLGFVSDDVLSGDLRLKWRRSSQISRVIPHRLVVVAVAASLAIVAIGGVTSSTAVSYRFAAPVRPGVDALFIGTQTNDVGSWLHEHAAPGSKIFTDQFVSQVVFEQPKLTIATKVARLWDLTFYKKFSYRVVQRFLIEKVNYVIVDQRMASMRPHEGYWYFSGEPLANSNKLIPAKNIFRFHCLNWLSAEFVTKDYTIYQVKPELAKRDIAHHSTGELNACMSEFANG
jgi:hypothetical protein